jgi:hypothetical protein
MQIHRKIERLGASTGIIQTPKQFTSPPRWPRDDANHRVSRVHHTLAGLRHVRMRPKRSNRYAYRDYGASIWINIIPGTDGATHLCDEFRHGT